LNVVVYILSINFS